MLPVLDACFVFPYDDAPFACVFHVLCVHPANSEVGQNVTNAASGKAGGPTNGTTSSAPPPPPSPSARADASPAKRGSRKVDGSLVQSGVIDVDAVD